MLTFENWGANACFGKAGLTAGTTTTMTIANTISYTVGGVFKSKASVSNTATPTTDALTGAAFKAVGVNYGSVFTIGLDGSGNIKVAQGQIKALDVAGNFIDAPQFAPMPDAAIAQGQTSGPYTAIGYLVVKVGSTGAAWTFGSSNLAGPPTGVTLSWNDVAVLPARPQVS